VTELPEHPVKTYYVAKRASDGQYIVSLDLPVFAWSANRVQALNNGCFWDCLERAEADRLGWKNTLGIDIELESVRIELVPDEDL
jgi:hypothetical protein